MCEGVKVFDSILVNGKEYSKTLDSWLHRMYKDAHIKSILKTKYEYQKWRLFYLMSSESFNFNEGTLMKEVNMLLPIFL
jgi:hypothetical protein